MKALPVHPTTGHSPLRGTWAAIVVVLAVACGEGRAFVSNEEACAHMARAACSRMERCSAGYLVQRDHGDMAACEATQRRTCMDSLLRRDTGNTADREDRCAAAIERQSCAGWLAGESLPECRNAEGPLGDRDRCVSSNQCKSGYCDIPANQVCGQCGVRQTEGGPCDTSSDCTGGTTCAVVDSALQTLRCVRRVTVDGACNATTPCASGLACVGASTSMMRDGKCQPLLLKEGEPCDPRLRVASDCRTDLGLACNTNSMTCTRRQLVRIGETCGTMDDGTSVTCLAGATCERPLDPPTGVRPRLGVCIARAAAGSACDIQDGPNCLPNHICEVDEGSTTAGICKPRDYLACPR